MPLRRPNHGRGNEGAVYKLITCSLYDGRMEREPIDQTPRARRQSARLQGKLRGPTGQSAPVLVANISYERCQIWSDRDLTCGETITLSLPGRGDIDGQVRWTADVSAGINFLTGASAVDDRLTRIGV